MRPLQIVGLIVAATVVVIILYSLRTDSSPQDYHAQLLQERVEKDSTMKNDKESPFADSSGSFSGLKYFPPDERYRVRARLVPIENKKTISLPTSDGQAKVYLEYAVAEFELDGVASKLLILEIADSGPYRGTLFTAFADETSAGETYGAGRYLDLKKIAGATSVELDFNRAYNPYCAYSDRFSCPFPPREIPCKWQLGLVKKRIIRKDQGNKFKPDSLEILAILVLLKLQS